MKMNNLIPTIPQDDLINRHYELSESHHDLFFYCGWILTWSRIPLLFMLLFQLTHVEYRVFASFTILLIVVMDILDGELFNFSKTIDEKAKTNRHTFDAIGDRVVIFSAILAALTAGIISTTLFLVILTRELILVGVVVNKYLKTQRILVADSISKIGTTIIALVLIDSVLNTGLSATLTALFVLFSYFGLQNYRSQ